VVQVPCVVYLDENEDGVRQVGEPSLEGVFVTNGETVVPTDVNGSVSVAVDPAVYRFATLTVPAGYWPTTSWFHRVDSESSPDTVRFGLKTFPATAADPVRWVHISDTQTQSWGQAPDVAQDLAEINALADPPAFLVNTGDLVEVGSDTAQWEHYLSQIATSLYPVLGVPGNHDTLGTGPILENYEKYAGPPYYDLRAGSWHFVFLNSEVPDVSTPAQDTWMSNAVAATPPGLHRVLYRHRMLAGTSSATVQSYVDHGFVAGFSGHWHALSISRHRLGIMDFNLSRTSMGPLDRTPRSFAIVELRSDGSIDYSLRRLDVDHRAVITHPQIGEVTGGDSVDVFVQAYDSSSPVALMTGSLSSPSGRSTTFSLSQEGVSLWRGTAAIAALGSGPSDLVVTGHFEDGTPISVHQEVLLGTTIPLLRGPGPDWPMFRKTAAGSSFVATRVSPPLRLAWSTPLPGMVALSSPVVAGGRVLLGCRGESADLSDSGVLCCDARTGSPRWFATIPGGVALAPAVVGSTVLVSSMADSVIALDLSTGASIWRTTAPGNRYKMTAPVYEGGTAWVGSEPTPIQIDVSSGGLSWTSDELGQIWYPAIYSAPAIGPQHVYYGFYGVPGAAIDGFSVVSRATGSLLRHENGSFRSPIWAGDRVLVIGGPGLNNQYLSARDPLGNVVWTSSTNLDRSTGSPALGRDVVVAPGAGGRVEAFDASDGAHRWTHTVGFSLYDMSPNRRDQRDTIGTPAITDDVVWIGSLDGNLYALDLFTGDELWRWNVGAPIASSPAASGHRIFVGASDGHLYCFAEAWVPDVSRATLEAPPAGRSGSVAAFFAPTPNPSRAGVRFEWVIPTKKRVRIDVFDVAGRRVRTVVDEPRNAGEQFALWDGRGDDGQVAGAGIYLARIRSGDWVATRKLVRLSP
jgi:outer membrane protein assembly factor BamB